MKIAHAAKEGGENDSRGAIQPESTRREIARSDVVVRQHRDTILIVAAGEQRHHLTDLVGDHFDLAFADSADIACGAIEIERPSFVLASAEACKESLLSAIAIAGLSRACAFVAAPGDIERLVEAYASQFTFRVVSRDIGQPQFEEVLATALSPRTADRRSLPGITVELRLSDGRTTLGSLLDLSNRGLAVRMDARAGLLLPGTTIRNVQLFDQDDPLLDGVGATARYVEVLAAGGVGAIAYKLGLEFQRSAAPQSGDDLFVTEPVRIRALLTEGLRRCSLMLSLANTPRAVAAGRSQLRPDSSTLEIEATAPSQVDVLDVVEGRFELAGSSYSFLASVAAVTAREDESETYALTLPKALRVVRQRRSIRFRPDPAAPISVTPVSPFGGSLGSRPVLNVTAAGAAFELHGTDDLLPVGTRLRHFMIHLQDGSTIASKASVRSLTRSPSSGATVCGVEFEGLDGLTRAKIADAIAHAGQPTVRDGSGTPFEDLFRFFTETNFLYPEKLASLDVPGVTQTLGTLLSKPNDLLKTTLVVADERIQAHASGFRVYEHTWMLQHLAARPAGKTTMTRGRILNLAVIQYLEQLPGIEWVKIWFRPQNRWPARVFGRFARRLADPRLSSFRTYAYLSCTAPIAPIRDPEITVRPASDADLPAIEAHFVARRDPVVQAADSLTADGLRLGAVNRAYASMGLERRRDLLIAERRGTLVGFATAEVSSPGLNFSELTNAFRVFTLEEGDSAVRRALIQETTAHYRHLGRNRIIALSDAGEIDDFAALGFSHAKDYSCWTWHRSQYQAFCEHVIRLRA